MMPVKKPGLGILNPVASAQEKYFISQQGIVELTRAVMGGGAFSNADYLLTLGEEILEVKQDLDAA